ncbi:Six-hairpin glycosidase-like protein [Podospora australis]|uniref:Trehalase n=1 Tax=Podospora australis TaxID=1536484 RepID=A0AAN7ANH7_9PEZI|nr:Six-hairpin glycosidase-like protein [Podospora australis]
MAPSSRRSRKVATAIALFATLTSTASALYINGSVTAPCDSPIYCYGDLLRDVELARPFSDSKTFVDMPTRKSVEEVLEAYNKLSKPLSNNTELNAFLTENFEDAGGELQEVSNDELETKPVFLNNIENPVIREFTRHVINIWPDLTRRYAGPGNCSECANSFIPINRTFVVAGGRFREPYYWDSYWIIEGLLRTGGAFTQISKNIIENFLDLIETIGFVPNGARIYYRNRSQPPLLSQMVRIYVEYTNDTSILERAVPLLIKEYQFWTVNRTVEVTGRDGKKHKLNRYNVNNNQPRPESYREDYITANNGSYYAETGIIYPVTQPLNHSQKASIYANLASGAESGWDYSSRWMRTPRDAAEHIYFPLRSLNVIETVPVDLNSILYWNEATIADFLKKLGNHTMAGEWHKAAQDRSNAMYHTMWNSTLWSYFDYNVTSHAQNIYVPLDKDALAREKTTAPPGQQVFFNVGQLFPFWTGAAPDQLKNNPLAVQHAFSRIDSMLKEKAGGIPSTNYYTGQQWDEPNVWPPLQHAIMEGLLKTPATFGEDDPAYQAVQNTSLKLAQRYLDSTFCTWYATGGSTSKTPKLEGIGPEATGTMFEKYSDNSTNVAGGGGEYEVVEGFGWTNGVLIWVVDKFGDKLKTPDCGNITAAHVHRSQKRDGIEGRSAVQLDPRDAQFTKKFGSVDRKSCGTLL